MAMTHEGTHGLWYFPAPGPRTTKPNLPHRVLEGRLKREHVRRAGYAASSAVLQRLHSVGADARAVFETQAATSLARRMEAQSNRCPACWHDRAQRCICSALDTLAPSLPVRVLILMHHKEYLRASDDAKLLLMMLPAERVRLFIFGRPGDLDNLHSELDEDPDHALVLWPADGALTVEEWRASALPESSAWARGGLRTPPTRTSPANGPSLPLLRVVVLDAVYRSARTMFRHLCKARAGCVGRAPLPAVALHPKTLSVYSRAQHGYAQASARSVGASADPEALRICTVEAYALLLEELGEEPELTAALVQAVVINNDALALHHVSGQTG